jgi:glycosyltransferase involved in cell wall biosynthesis
MPAVSVIMPAYNVAPYIGDALASVLAQTFTDFEVVVTDDGSTDETAAIVGPIASRDERVRLLRKTNGGLSSARNHALRHAAGDVFALLDSDDLWDPGFLEAQVAVLRARPDVGVVTGNARYLGGPRDGQPARPWPDSRPEPSLATILADEQAIFIMSVFRREVYASLGDFDESMRTNEDYDYWLRAAAAGFQFARHDRPLGQYRVRGDSLSASEERMLRGILRVYGKLAPSLEDRPERAILDRQVGRFEAELLAAQAKHAIEAGRFGEAAAFLDALHERRPALSIAIARLMARWTPGMLSRAYTLRRSRQLS